LRRKFCFFTLALLMGGTIPALGQDLHKSLNDLYRGKILILRSPTKSAHIDLDGTADPKPHKSTEPWTMYGRMLVEDVKLGKNKLEVDGARLAYQSDDARKQLVPHKSSSRLVVRIKLQQPPGSMEEATAALARAFALTPDDVVNSVPEFWRSYLQGLVAPHPGETSEAEARKNALADFGKRTESGGDQVFMVGGEVKAPKITHQPEPEYSEEARSIRFQGTAGFDVVVDRKGVISHIQIKRAAGMGLDEKAMEGLKSWRFKPATRNGEPVAVALYIEVAFHLF
jgi:TonB family protein